MVLELVARVVRCLVHKVLVSKLIESRDLVEAEIKAKFISDEVELFSSEVSKLPLKEAATTGSGHGMYSPDSYSLFEQEIAWVQMSAPLLRESCQNIKTEIAQKRAGVSLRPRKRAKTNDPTIKPEVDTESDEETKENEIIGDIIICATEARTAVVTAAVKAENLPYVR